MKNEIPAEKKLEVLHQIRTQYQKNQSDLMRRESLLYGQTSIPKYSESPGYFPDNEIPGDTGAFHTKTLKIRYALAAILVLLVIICDRRQITICGINSQVFLSMLQEDYEEELKAWSEELVTASPIPQ